MTVIEQSTLAYVGQKNNGSSNSPTVNKQAWLRYLDQSGLVDALNNTQLMMAGIGKFPSQPARMQAPQHALALTRTPIAESIKPSFGKPTENAAQLRSNVPLASIPIASKAVSGPEQIALISDLDSKQLEITAIDHQQIINTRVAGGDRLNYQEWSLRNMAVLRSENGVELWIRDAEIKGDAKLQQLLKGLREHMGVLGASLVRIVVNGKEVFSEQSSAKQQTLEE